MHVWKNCESGLFTSAGQIRGLIFKKYVLILDWQITPGKAFQITLENKDKCRASIIELLGKDNQKVV